MFMKKRSPPLHESVIQRKKHDRMSGGFNIFTYTRRLRPIWVEGGGAMKGESLDEGERGRTVREKERKKGDD